jgi:hypothetical protein
MLIRRGDDGRLLENGIEEGLDLLNDIVEEA